MTVPLPKPVDAYFSASNAHDAAAIARAFATDGIVHDEGKVHRGRAAITAWALETIEKYRTQVVPLAVSSAGDTAAVTAKVSGTFPGSPIELTFNFESGNGGIKSLKIG
jgi:uncharacterized protein (TIGR02246 family)